MDMQKQIDEHILLNYFTGSLSADQKQEVEQWLQESEENRKLARDVQYIYMATDTLNTIKEVNSAEALEQVKKKFRKPNNTNYLVWFQRVAAILVFPLLVSTIYFITKKEPAEYIEVKTNPGMVATLNLPDGSKVWLNSGSYLKHPQKFTGDTRTVELDGEAYFSVQKDKSKRFIVNTPFDLKAEVLGTEFNIEAYKGSNQVTTSLISGSVKLSFRNKENEEESFIMKPDDEVAYNIKNKGIKTNTSYLPTQIAWKDGLVVFRNTSFEEALKILDKRFNTKFIIKN
ncbi:FecR domain-containing protein, partial [uncultured Parabacteroides sp.]|uniref:FecR family protein n=1 Tax=uncultured Parabacteroides sp. TaxID=512312 RepID=UPI0025FE3963